MGGGPGLERSEERLRVAAIMPSDDHSLNPLTAGGGCIFVGVRVRPIGEGRGANCSKVQVDAASGRIVVDADAQPSNDDEAEAAAARLQAATRGKSTRRVVKTQGPKAAAQLAVHNSHKATAALRVQAVSRGILTRKALSQGNVLSEAADGHTRFEFAGVYQAEDNARLFELVGRPLVNNVRTRLADGMRALPQLTITCRATASLHGRCASASTAPSSPTGRRARARRTPSARSANWAPSTRGAPELALIGLDCI